MKEEKFKLSTCIGGWYIDPKICDDIVTYFENSDRKKPGHTVVIINLLWIENINLALIFL